MKCRADLESSGDSSASLLELDLPLDAAQHQNATYARGVIAKPLSSNILPIRPQLWTAGRGSALQGVRAKGRPGKVMPSC